MSRELRRKRTRTTTESGGDVSATKDAAAPPTPALPSGQDLSRKDTRIAWEAYSQKLQDILTQARFVAKQRKTAERIATERADYLYESRERLAARTAESSEWVRESVQSAPSQALPLRCIIGHWLNDGKAYRLRGTSAVRICEQCFDYWHRHAGSCKEYLSEIDVLRERDLKRVPRTTRKID